MYCAPAAWMDPPSENGIDLMHKYYQFLLMEVKTPGWLLILVAKNYSVSSELKTISEIILSIC